MAQHFTHCPDKRFRSTFGPGQASTWLSSGIVASVVLVVWNWVWFPGTLSYFRLPISKEMNYLAVCLSSSFFLGGVQYLSASAMGGRIFRRLQGQRRTHSHPTWYLGALKQILKVCKVCKIVYLFKVTIPLFRESEFFCGCNVNCNRSLNSKTQKTCYIDFKTDKRT